MKKVYLLFFSWALCASSVWAQPSLPLYEPFSSTPLGTLAPQNGWTGNSGEGLAAQVVDSTLSFPGLSTKAESFAVRVGNQPSGGLQTLPFAAQTTQVYASFLIRLSEMPIAPAAATATYVALGSGNTSAGCVYAFPNEDGTTFELGFSAAPNQTTASNNKTNRQFQIGQTIMIVLAFTPNAAGSGTAGSLNVWINPPAESLAPGGSEPTPNFPNRTGSTVSNINSVHLRSGAGTRKMIFDELRVGNSWNDIISASTVLPVSLIDLKLTTNKNISTLNWTSKNEDNFSKYTVMFSSNGADFIEVGTVLGRGNNSTYSFSHSHMGEGFFKLKMVDVDGRFSYSRVLRANARSISVRVGPNPASDRLYISGMPEGTNTVVLYTMSGTTVQTQRIKDSNLTLSLSGLPAGNYVLKIVNNGKDLQSMIISK